MNDMLKWIAIVMLAAGLGWVSWQQYKIQTEHDRENLAQAVQTDEKQIAALTETVKRHETQFQTLADHSNQLTDAVKMLDRSMREGNPQWRYAQVQFYLERAAQETYVMKDPVLAKSWLQAALQSTVSLNQPNLLPVQEAIQSDIQDLSQKGGNAMSQAMVSLSLLADTIQTLPHKQAIERMPTDDEPNPAATPSDDWQTALKSGWHELKSLVRIRTVNSEVVPYFSADEKSMIDQNVSLILMQASFNAMRGNQDLYAHEVTQAKEWIMRYYDVTSPKVEQTLNTLNQLSTVPVNFVPPRRLKSVDAWSAFSQQNGKSS